VSLFVDIGNDFLNAAKLSLYLNALII